MDELGMPKRDEERILDEDGNPTGFYVFSPTYPISMVKNDIKRLLGICKLLRKEENNKKHSSFAMDLTNLSNELDKGSGSPTPGAAFLDSDSEEENLDSMGRFLPLHLKQAVMLPSPPRLAFETKNQVMHRPTPISHSFAEF
jgi:hypothetical protein